MQREMAMDGIQIHAKFTSLSERRSCKRESPGARISEPAQRKTRREVASLLLGIAACVLVSLGTGGALLFLNIAR